MAWWQALVRVPETPIWTHAPSVKRSRQNYTLLNGANGLQRLTVPTDRKSRRAYYDSVRINYGRPWQRSHHHAYPTIYHNAPFFEHYWPELEPLITARPERLIDYTLPQIEWLATHILPGQRLNLVDSVDTPDFRHWALTADCAPPDFERVEYYRLFDNDTPNVSILDLLFAEGPQTRSMLAHA